MSKRGNHRLKVLLTGLLLFISALVYALIAYYLPDNVNPVKPLRIGNEPTFITQSKINRLKSNPGDCFAVLDNSDLEYERIEDRSTGEDCGFKEVVMLRQSGISYGGDIVLKCPALVALAIWEKHDVQPLALEMFEQQIIRIRHFGTYACRNVNNVKQGRRSQHAYANAIDIAGFVLADGTNISVLEDWGQNTPKGDYLQALHKAACKRFTTVLGPDYNAAHHNHFHFDQGGWSICR